MANPKTSKPGKYQHINHLGLDEFERGVLAVLRRFLATHANPGTQCWHHAYLIAVDRWGEAVGLAAAHALSKYVNAVLRFRAGTFDFLDPLDLDMREFATEDEAFLIAVLHYMRRDQTNKARDAVAALTSGQMDPDIIRAGLSFASRFSSGANAKPKRSPAPALRVVG